MASKNRGGDMEKTLTLTEFLLARIAEDEEVASALATVDEPTGYTIDVGYAVGFTADGDVDSDSMRLGALWNGPRVLAECAAKRRTVSLCQDIDDGWAVMARLAAVWSNHADYRSEWAV